MKFNSLKYINIIVCKISSKAKKKEGFFLKGTPFQNYSIFKVKW